MHNEILSEGYWSIASQKHLKTFTTDSRNIDEFDSINLAGKCGRFIDSIRGNGKIDDIKKLEKFANTVGIGKKELHKIILPEIEAVSERQIELVKDGTNEIIGIEEYIQDKNNVFDITGKIYRHQNPSSIEQIAIHTMENTRKMPYLMSELSGIINLIGFCEEDIELSIALQKQFKLIQATGKLNPNDPLISNEYIWGSNHEKIAMAMANISFDNKQSLKDVIEIVQNLQGIPTETLPHIDNNLLLLAIKTGMISPVKIITNRDFNKEFCFCSNIFQPLTGSDDLMDDVKLLLASIRFAERYTQGSTIDNAKTFLNALINHDSVGPHPANQTDYTLLESKGIVKVVHETKRRWNSYYNGYYDKTGYCLKLLKKDVGIEALRILKSDNAYFNEQSNLNYNATALNTSGIFINPEESRIMLGKSPEMVKEAEDHFIKVFRNECL